MTHPISTAAERSTPPAVPAGRVPRMIAAGVAAPVLVATLLTAGAGLAEIAGHTPFAYDAPRNIAEAAGLDLGAEVLRMLRQGHDPTRLLPVRPDIISSEITQVTALEAAVWSRRMELVRLLDREGAIRGGETKHHIACVAKAVGVESIVEYLAPGGLSGCDTEQVIRAIQARAQ